MAADVVNVQGTPEQLPLPPALCGDALGAKGLCEMGCSGISRICLYSSFPKYVLILSPPPLGPYHLFFQEKK